MSLEDIYLEWLLHGEAMAMKNSKIIIQKSRGVVVTYEGGCLREVSTVVISMGKFWWSLMEGVTRGRSTIII